MTKEHAFQQGRSRRLMWRVGRHLYRRARGEIANAIESNGETYVQACVIKATTGANAPLVVFDVGANLGEWTQAFLAQLPADRVAGTRVLVFEPVAETFSRLQSNLKGSVHGAATEAYQLAMSNESGTAEMVMLSETGGTNSLHYDEKLSGDALGVATIEKTTLDAFCKANDIEHVHLLKCDTEGHDALAMAGARGLFETGKIDVAQFEYNQRWVYARSYLKDIFDLIDGLPYRVARVCPDHIEVFEEWHFELERFFEGNYLVIREPALAWFDTRFGHFDASNTYA